MFRLLGFFAGSIAAIVALFALLGTPSFELSSATDDDRFDVAVQQLKDKQQTQPVPVEFDTVTNNSRPPRSPTPTQDAPEAGTTDTAERALAVTDNTLDIDESFADVAGTDTDAMTDLPVEPDRVEPAVDAANAEPVWQPFWNPFRSELAAAGFVSRLERVTGLDYRVERVKNGVYEVAFSYRNDDERSANLSQIAAATGLDLSAATQ